MFEIQYQGGSKPILTTEWLDVAEYCAQTWASKIQSPLTIVGYLDGKESGYIKQVEPSESQAM